MSLSLVLSNFINNLLKLFLKLLFFDTFKVIVRFEIDYLKILGNQTKLAIYILYIQYKWALFQISY